MCKYEIKKMLSDSKKRQRKHEEEEEEEEKEETPTTGGQLFLEELTEIYETDTQPAKGQKSPVKKIGGCYTCEVLSPSIIPSSSSSSSSNSSQIQPSQLKLDIPKDFLSINEENDKSDKIIKRTTEAIVKIVDEAFKTLVSKFPSSQQAEEKVEKEPPRKKILYDLNQECNYTCLVNAIEEEGGTIEDKEGKWGCAFYTTGRGLRKFALYNKDTGKAYTSDWTALKPDPVLTNAMAGGFNGIMTLDELLNKK